MTGRPHLATHTTTVSQQLLLFSNHSLHAAWVIIHLLRATQQAFMYITPSLCLSVGPLPFHHTSQFALPQMELHRHDHTLLTIVCGERRLQSALLSTIKENQMIPQDGQGPLSSLFLSRHFCLAALGLSLRRTRNIFQQSSSPR